MTSPIRCCCAQHHSTLILAARITFAHFSVSSRMSLPKSAGEPGSTVPPRSANRALTLGSASAALISALSFSMIAGGVSLGATSPTHWLASKSGNELGERRNVRQRLGARRGGHRQCAQRARFDMPERRRQLGECHLDLSADQISHRGRGAAIRDMSQIRTGHHLEIFADDVRGRTVAARAHRDLAGIGLGIGDEFRDSFRRNCGIHLHELRHPDDAADRRGVTDEIEVERLETGTG